VRHTAISAAVVVVVDFGFFGVQAAFFTAG